MPDPTPPTSLAIPTSWQAPSDGLRKEGAPRFLLHGLVTVSVGGALIAMAVALGLDVTGASKLTSTLKDVADIGNVLLLVSLVVLIR